MINLLGYSQGISNEAGEGPNETDSQRQSKLNVIMPVPLTGRPWSIAGLYFQPLAACVAQSFRSGWPERDFVIIVLPSSSKAISTGTEPETRAALATRGYDGSTFLSAEAISSTSVSRTTLGGDGCLDVLRCGVAVEATGIAIRTSNRADILIKHAPRIIYVTVGSLSLTKLAQIVSGPNVPGQNPQQNTNRGDFTGLELL